MKKTLECLRWEKAVYEAMDVGGKSVGERSVGGKSVGERNVGERSVGGKSGVEESEMGARGVMEQSVERKVVTQAATLQATSGLATSLHPLGWRVVALLNGLTLL